MSEVKITDRFPWVRNVSKLKVVCLHLIISVLMYTLGMLSLRWYNASTYPDTVLSAVAVSQCGAILGGVVTTKDGKVHGFPVLPPALRDSLTDLNDDSIMIIHAPCPDKNAMVKIPRTDANFPARHF